jgi:hypothetical protein
MHPTVKYPTVKTHLGAVKVQLCVIAVHYTLSEVWGPSMLSCIPPFLSCFVIRSSPYLAIVPSWVGQMLRNIIQEYESFEAPRNVYLAGVRLIRFPRPQAAGSVQAAKVRLARPVERCNGRWIWGRACRVGTFFWGCHCLSIRPLPRVASAPDLLTGSSICVLSRRTTTSVSTAQRTPTPR